MEKLTLDMVTEAEKAADIELENVKSWLDGFGLIYEVEAISIEVVFTDLSPSLLLLAVLKDEFKAQMRNAPSGQEAGAIIPLPKRDKANLYKRSFNAAKMQLIFEKAPFLEPTNLSITKVKE